MGTVAAGRITLSFFLMLLCSAGVGMVAQNLPPMPAAAPPTTSNAPDYSGMYAFRRDGEFIQLNVEDDGRLTGFVSRYGDLDSDKGQFLNQFFKQAKLEGNKISFTTAAVHGVSFDFKGTVVRGEGKSPNDEAYYVLKGTLTEASSGDGEKTASKSEEVAFKSFPRDLNPSQ
jgi:hypothetical protein